ncbi:unnamed protein product [marine sediment metagenome]|uniref:Uncharacterized protein n=1 Tax=marine sediment metagenome TaxID=412755 RepID=X1TR01_9ZZZZ
MGQRGPAPTYLTTNYKDKAALRRAARAQALKKQGYTIREIVSELGKSERTICYYLKVSLNASIMRGLEEDEKRRDGRADLMPPPIEIKEGIDAVSFCEDPAYHYELSILPFRPPGCLASFDQVFKYLQFLTS